MVSFGNSPNSINSNQKLQKRPSAGQEAGSKIVPNSPEIPPAKLPTTPNSGSAHDNLIRRQISVKQPEINDYIDRQANYSPSKLMGTPPIDAHDAFRLDTDPEITVESRKGGTLFSKAEKDRSIQMQAPNSELKKSHQSWDKYSKKQDF